VLQNLSFDKLSSNAFILVLAGSETTATTLAGATYLILTHPDVLEKLKREVRSTFKEVSQININSVNNLTYMLAILNEALRMYPPVRISEPCLSLLISVLFPLCTTRVVKEHLQFMKMTNIWFPIGDSGTGPDGAEGRCSDRWPLCT
jgi:uncharacterized protein YybS (DUF2232 family)